MKMYELTEAKKKRISDRAGVYPYYQDTDGKQYVYMMIPSKAKFGGPLPQMAKGGIDPGESPEQAAIREGWEEVGLKERNIKSMAMLTTTDIRGKKEEYKITVFVAEIIDEDDFDTPGFESKWAGWVELEEALKISRKNQQQFVHMIKNKFHIDSLEESLNEDNVSDLQARLDQIYTPGEKLFNHPDVKEIRDLKAKISFAKSQDELKQKGFNKLDQEITGKETFNDTIEERIARLKPSIDIIMKDCQPYLKAVGGDISKYTLYRGLRGTNTQTMTGRVRLDDRKSAGMDTLVHDKVNDYFVEKFGEPFRNALFTSADPDFAKDYGNLFIIFPIGEFTFIWSDSVRDMYDIEHYITDAIDEDIDDVHPGDEPMNYLKRFLDEKEYINHNFKEAISSKNEIMIRCKAYHGINLTEYFNRDDNDDDSKGDASAINKVIQLIQGML